MHKVHCHEGKDDGIDPAHHITYELTLGILPPCPRDELSNIGIEEEGHHEKSPPALYPEEEEKVEGNDDAALNPLLEGSLLKFAHKSSALKVKQITHAQQSLMLCRILGRQHGTKGKATTALGIVGDGDAIGLRVVTDAMNAGYLTLADRAHG